MRGPPVRIGNQTSSHVPASIPFEFAVTSGFRAFEWFSDPGPAGWSEIATDLPTRTQWKQTAIDRDIRFSVHAPFASDPTTLMGAEAIRHSIEFAHDVGATTVNLHMSALHSAEIFSESVAALVKIARPLGIRLTLENTPETSPEKFNAVFRSLQVLPETTDWVGMCFDSGHANLFHDTRNDYLQFVDRLADDVPILQWHAHENWGDRDTHLALFTGPAGLDPAGIHQLIQRLFTRRFCGSIILEQWPSPPQLLISAADRLLTLLSAVGFCTEK